MLENTQSWEGRELGGTEGWREASTDVAPGAGFSTTVVEATKGMEEEGRGKARGRLKSQMVPHKTECLCATWNTALVCPSHLCAQVRARTSLSFPVRVLLGYPLPCSRRSVTTTAGHAEDFPDADVTAEATSVLAPSSTQQSGSSPLLSPNVIVGEGTQEKSPFEWDRRVSVAEGLGLSLLGMEQLI